MVNILNPNNLTPVYRLCTEPRTLLVIQYYSIKLKNVLSHKTVYRIAVHKSIIYMINYNIYMLNYSRYNKECTTNYNSKGGFFGTFYY